MRVQSRVVVPSIRHRLKVKRSGKNGQERDGPWGSRREGGMYSLLFDSSGVYGQRYRHLGSLSKVGRSGITKTNYFFQIFLSRYELCSLIYLRVRGFSWIDPGLGSHPPRHRPWEVVLIGEVTASSVVDTSDQVPGLGSQVQEDPQP